MGGRSWRLFFGLGAAWMAAHGSGTDSMSEQKRERAPPCTPFPVNLSGFQLLHNDWIAAENSSADECRALCCSLSNCTTWNIQIASTNPTHTPLMCWLAASQTVDITPQDDESVWVGGTRADVPDPRKVGAVIQPLSSWFAYKAASTTPTLLRELTDQSVQTLRQRANDVTALKSKSQWTQRVAETRAHFNTVFSPLPPKNREPPTYKVVKTLTRPGYTCEKILYQTRPGFWVPAALWVPTGGGPGHRPGILLVSGHTPDGFRSNNVGGPVTQNAPGDDDYEVVQINLVSRGFVVLAFDPIGQGERMQYADLPIGKPDPNAPWSKGEGVLWSSTSDHEYIGRQLLLSGVGLMSFWLHDEMISLDVLAAHPKVNADALGVVGCSGGGTQSSYLAAMDPRVKAASIACYTSTFEIDRLWAAGGASDGEQTWPHGIFLGLDKPDLLEVRANLSTQVLITTADTCFPAAGGMAAVAEAKPAYKALGGNLDTFTGVWHHGWVLPTREQIYGFFCRALNFGFDGNVPPSCQSSDEINVSVGAPAAEWTDSDLQVTSTGQVNTAPECGASAEGPSATVHTFSSEMARQLLDKLDEGRQSQADYLRVVRSSAARVSGYQELPTPAPPPRFLGAQFPYPHPPGRSHPSYPPLASEEETVGLVERWMVFGEGDCFTVLTVFLPFPIVDIMSPRPENLSAVVFFQRAAADLSGGVPQHAAAAVTAGYIAVIAEVCGFGESGDAFTDELTGLGNAAMDMAMELGRSIPGYMAGDMVRVYRYLRSREDVKGVALAIASDFLDVALLHATLASPTDAPGRLALVGGRSNLGQAATERMYAPQAYYAWIFGLLKQYDLSDCVAAVASVQDVLLLGPVDGAALTPLNSSIANETYGFASKAAASGSGSLSIQPGNFTSLSSTLAALAWLHA